MKRALAAALLAGFSWLSVVAGAAAGEAGDAVFAERGPWSLDADGLGWSLTVRGPADTPGFLPVADGSVTLTQTIDPSDQKPVLELVETTDSRTRKIGPFPISGGDPVLTFFLEQTTRDMAKLTGGSPFYIRNRIKDAVFRGGRFARTAETATATFRPFEDDPNAARMQGFQTLTLTFLLDSDSSHPIREMQASTEGDSPGYLNRMVLQ